MLIEVAPTALRDAGRALVAAEKAMFDGTSDGLEYAERLGDWGDLGGYELEGRWEAAASRSVKTPVTDFATRKVGELSGGERKRLVLDLLLTSGADVLLLDEPDNYLDVPTRAWLEEQIRACASTILMVSHGPDPALARGHEGDLHRGLGVLGPRRLVHHLPRGARRAAGQARRRLERWNQEERRLFQHMKIMKQRAAQNFKNAARRTRRRRAGRSS